MSYEFPPLGGGGAKIAYGLTKEFVKMGHEVDLITMGFSGLRRYEVVNGVHVHRVPCLRRSVDISHPHELFSYLVMALPLAIKLVHRRKHEINHTHFLVPDGILALALQRLVEMPYVVTAHGSDVPDYNPDRFVVLHKMIAPGWRSIVSQAHCVVCPSRYLEALIHRHKPDAHTTLIPNAIDTCKFYPGHPKGKKILVVTRMFKRKGVQHLLEALHGSDLGYEVNIVGIGPYLQSLRSMAKKLPIPVRFHGWLENDSTELKRLYETSGVFVFLSEAENFPVVLLEAMSAGMAIVTADSTGCREVVGDAALVVPPGDSRALREVLSALSADSELRHRLGLAARRRLEERFNWETVATQHVEVFEKILMGLTPSSG